MCFIPVIKVEWVCVQVSEVGDGEMTQTFHLTDGLCLTASPNPQQLSVSQVRINTGKQQNFHLLGLRLAGG